MSRRQIVSPFSRSARALVLVVVALLLAFGLIGCARPAPQTAHVVVQFADGATTLRPISWTGELTRVAALELAGLTVAADPAGEVVCSIAGEGCPSDDCFCPANRWAQGHWDGAGWDTETWPPPPVANGDVIAFRLGAQPDHSDWGLAGYMADAPTYLAASRAIEWLGAQQGDDGSYDDGFDQIGASVRSLLAISAAGYDPAVWGSPSLSAFLLETAAERTSAYAQGSAAAAGKLAVATAWAGLDPANVAGLDLPALITAAHDPATGAFGGGSGDSAWAVLGLSAAGQPVPQGVIAFLEGSQLEDGGWTWNEMQPQSEVQHTALVIQALLAAGVPRDSETVGRALALVRAAANPDGGYPYQAPGDSDVATTAAVIQALLSVGDMATDGQALAAARGYLQSQQDAEGAMQGFSPLFATQESIPALMGRPFGARAQGQ